MRYFIITMCFFAMMIGGCSNPDINNVDTHRQNTVGIAASSLFRDGWNLDAGLDRRPIGSLTVTIHTSNKFLAGTDSDIYFGMKLSDGTTIWKQLDKAGYNDFEQGDLDDYYLYVGSQTFYPNQITTMYLRNETKGSGPDWHVDYIKLRINGVNVYSKTIGSWVNAGTTYTMNSVSLPAATDIPVLIN